MCGIGGILRLRNHSPPQGAAGAIPEDWLAAMDQHLAHRGPDGHGLFRDRVRLPDGSTAEIALIHRRLAILDPAGGAQPMLATDRLDPAGLNPAVPPSPLADDLLALVFNGCIYNHRPLRRELISQGLRFRTDHSDTEAVLHAFRRWNLAFPQHLEGMFAVGLWDRKHGRLVLARDRAGEKPLYTASFNTKDHSRCLAFASTVPALVAVIRLGADNALQIDQNALARWIRYGYDREPPIRGIHVVPPGHTAITAANLSDWIFQPHFQPPPHREPGKTITLDELDRLLAAAVAERMDSDVPLGCFLSGGIDSSLIAAYARKVKPNLATFCVRMPDARYDESAHAKMVARRLGTRHTTLEVSARPAEDLPSLIAQLGLPLGDSSLLPTYWVSAAARKHVTVALSGDGGDELFLGYERYVAAGLLRNLGPLLRAIPTTLLDRFHPRSRMHKLARLATASRHRGYEELLAIFPTPLLARLMPGIDPQVTALAPHGARISDPPLHDFLNYLPEDLLRKVDTASMAVALEVRAPMLATSILNTTLSLPVSTLAPDGPKSLLRSLARRYLPDAVVQRRKSGFAIPIGEWLRTDHGKLRTLMNDLLGRQSPLATLGIDPVATTALMEEHAAAKKDHGQRLYLLMVLALWTRWLHDA